MKQFSLILTLTLLIPTLGAFAQELEKEPVYRAGKFYNSQEMEIIFSFASIDYDSVSVDQNMRFTPVLNLAGHINYDVSKNLGFSAGLAIRNVGFIAKYPDAENDLKIKYRTYNLGLPIGFKIGNLNQNRPFFLFGGYEVEMPFHYKQKRFENGDKKEKITGWFSDRTELFTQSVFAGVQLPGGMALKVKYYLDSFFNQDYKEFREVEGTGPVEVQPFQGFQANVFYLSINWFPFKDSKLYLENLRTVPETFTTASYRAKKRGNWKR